MFEEITRSVIFTIVWTVLVLRTPFMVRDRRQRPLWSMLAVFAGGAVVIQSWFGVALNEATKIPHLNNLVQGLWGVLNMTVTLGFVLHLTRGEARPERYSSLRAVLALATSVGMVLLFACTPPGQRFTSIDPPPSFVAYAALAAAYMIGTAAVATWMLCRHLPLIQGKVLFIGLSMVAIGNATQVPFMIIRTAQRLAVQMSPELLQTAFVLNTTRFILVPLGCVITAVEPVRKAVLHWYRRVRIYSLWLQLRSATPDLTVSDPVSRVRDLIAVDHNWERLHRRVIEVRDSILYLHDTWAWPELLNMASGHGRHRTAAVACWLEVTRRLANAGAPKLHLNVDKSLLPEPLHGGATTHAELRSLLRLHKALRSRHVQEFAGRTVLGAPRIDRDPI